MIAKEMLTWLLERLAELEQKEVQLKRVIRESEVDKESGAWLGGGKYSEWQQATKEITDTRREMEECEALVKEFRGRVKK